MFVSFDAQWFQSYCRALLADDREVSRKHLPQAYEAIHKALRSSKLSQKDCKALREALHYLDLIKSTEVKKPSLKKPSLSEGQRSKRKSA
jgi:hypothetical protein